MFLSRLERLRVMLAMPGFFWITAIQRMESSVLYKKWGLTWLCSSAISMLRRWVYISSVSCSRCWMLMLISFTVRPICPSSSCGFSISGSKEKSLAAMRRSRALRRLTGREKYAEVSTARQTASSRLKASTVATVYTMCSPSWSSAVCNAQWYSVRPPSASARPVTWYCAPPISHSCPGASPAAVNPCGKPCGSALASVPDPVAINSVFRSA